MNADRKQAEELKIKNTGSKKFPYYEIMRNKMPLCATNSIENAEEIVKAMQFAPRIEITEEEIKKKIESAADDFARYGDGDQYVDDDQYDAFMSGAEIAIYFLSERKEQKTTEQQKGAPGNEEMK